MIDVFYFFLYAYTVNKVFLFCVLLLCSLYIFQLNKMMQEEPCILLTEELQRDSDNEDNDEEVIRTEKRSVKDIIRRFENNAVISESTPIHKDISIGNLTSYINPIQTHFHHLSPLIKYQDRRSTVSVNSILSNASEVSFESSSSGFISDRKSGTEFRIPRLTPPPAESFNDNSSESGKSSMPEEMANPERRLSFTLSASPVVMRRARQPPVIRRKSSVCGNQGHPGETLWSYGVTQNDLEKLLNLKRSEISDNEDDMNDVVESLNVTKINNENRENYVDDEVDEGEDSLSRDLSTDTLINDEDVVSDAVEDSGSTTSDVSETRSNYDNVSIKSISSFDMVPYQKLDSITVSSDEFGGEVCHAPDTEFLTVSAVNEWCVNNSKNHVLPIESKKEKYRRRLTERVNELIHTETVYTDRLRHVVEDYIPEMMCDDVSPAMKLLKPDIFANIEKIHRFHDQEFLPALRDCENDLRKLGQCFRKYEQKFNMYVMYSRNNKRATRLVFEQKHFFQERQKQLGDRLDLSSYLLEPVQRIPRYKLFLDDLVKTYTNYENEKCESDSRISKLSVDSDETGGSNGESEDDETPLESLKQAKMMIECVLTAIDGIMALENIRDCPSHINLLNQGRLLRQNEFFVMDTARRRKHFMRVFLFNKLVLLTVVYRKQLTVELFLYKDHIPVDELGITAKEQEDYRFSIWYKKRNMKTYKLETRDPSIRLAWVQDITGLLWEQAMSKKEMLLQERKKRISMISMNDDESADDRNDDKYNSLRGVPGEVRRAGDNKVRRTTWYCE